MKSSHETLLWLATRSDGGHTWTCIADSWSVVITTATATVYFCHTHHAFMIELSAVCEWECAALHTYSCHYVHTNNTRYNFSRENLSGE